MKRSITALAALAVTASCTAYAGPEGRHFKLSEEEAPGTVRFLSQRIELADGVTQSWVTITRTGSFSDPRYGDFMITPTHLEQMVANFNARTLGQDVFLDVAHKPNDGAAGKFVKLSVESGRLRGLVEWTPFGIDAVKNRGFAYPGALPRVCAERDGSSWWIVFDPAPTLLHIAALGSTFKFWYYAQHAVGSNAVDTTVAAPDRGLLLLRAQVEALRELAIHQANKPVSMRDGLSGTPRNSTPAALHAALLKIFQEAR